MRLVYFFAFLLVVGCQDNEADRPELLTKPAQQIGSTSAVLDAELTETGPIKPLVTGFLWGTPTDDLSIFAAPNRYVGSETSSKGPFSIKVENLAPGTTYSYRSFAADPGFYKIYYGAVVNFTTLP